jgi:hypothetical protein
MKSKRGGRRKASLNKSIGLKMRSGSNKSRDLSLTVDDMSSEPEERIPKSSLKGLYRDKKFYPPTLEEKC